MVVEKKRFVVKNLKKEEMAEWFKAADCKSVEFSRRRFKSCFLHYIWAKYNAAVACLLWEQKVMCSNHIISKQKVYKYHFKYDIPN